MKKQSVQIPVRHKIALDGLIRKPDGKGPFPAVIFVSGLGMTMHEWKNSFDEIAQKLIDIGIMTVQFTFPIFDAEGRCRELPLKRRGEIVEDVLSWVRKRSDVQKERIGVLAQSYGAVTVLGIDTRRIQTLLFVGGAYFPLKSIARVYTEKGVKINYNGDTSLPRSSGENTTVGKEFWKDIKTFDDIGRAKRLRFSVFMVHGDQDSKIPISDAQRVFDAIPSKRKKIKIFKGGDHGIVDVLRSMREELLKEVVEWFKFTL
ncbi:MAG: prolyl oligopeptidase family serine peptidase [Candidatus Gottesmanbacteria bacterium]|nr:prolyl oligopeptidase family serine peptidase [Candidatus Gottesmanbacteria bacterium]